MGRARAWLLALASAAVVMAAMAVLPSAASASWWEPSQAELENDHKEFPDWVEATEVGEHSATIVARFLVNGETHWIVQMKGPMCVYYHERSWGTEQTLARCEGSELDEEAPLAEKESHNVQGMGWWPDMGTVLGEGVVVGSNREELVSVSLPTVGVRDLVPGGKYIAYVRTSWSVPNAEGRHGETSDATPPAFTTLQTLTKKQLREKAKKEAQERRARQKRERAEAKKKRREEHDK